MEKKQQQLFDELNHWNDLPEFVMEDLTSFRKLIIHFRNEKDVNDFAELLKQNITPKQKSLWFPKIQIRSTKNMQYNDES